MTSRCGASLWNRARERAASTREGRPGEVAGPGLECIDQRGLTEGRDGEDLHVAIPVDLRLGRLRLFEDAMEVAAAEPEATLHGRATGMIRPRHPGASLGIDVEGRSARRGPAMVPVTLAVGSTLWCKASRGLDQARGPAAALVWPICDRTDPSAPGLLGVGLAVDLVEPRPVRPHPRPWSRCRAASSSSIELGETPQLVRLVERLDLPCRA